MCRQCARGGCAFYFRNRGAPTNRALASACSPRPNHPNYSQLGFGVHPPNPPSRGFSCSLLPLRSSAETVRFTATRTEMAYCRVVPRDLCRPRDEKQGFPTNTSLLAPCQARRQSKAGRLLPRRIWAGQGSARAGRPGQQAGNPFCGPLV